LVALANFMRLSLTKAAHVVATRAAWQEIRERSGRDDKFVCAKDLSSRPERSAVERSAVSLSVGSCNQFFRTLIGLDLQQFSKVDGRAEERV